MRFVGAIAAAAATVWWRRHQRERKRACEAEPHQPGSSRALKQRGSKSRMDTGSPCRRGSADPAHVAQPVRRVVRRSTAW